MLPLPASSSLFICRRGLPALLLALQKCRFCAYPQGASSFNLIETPDTHVRRFMPLVADTCNICNHVLTLPFHAYRRLWSRITVTICCREGGLERGELSW